MFTTDTIRRGLGAAVVLAAFAVTGCVAEPTAHATPPPAPAATATVVKVVDGDTIDVRDDNRGRLRVRIIGLDTPETRKPGYAVGCYGPEASANAHTQLDNRRVALLTDPTQDVTDRYGRTLAHVVRDDGYDYGTEAVRAGFGKAYVYDDRPSQHAAAIADAQREAQTRDAGLWGPPCHGHTDSVPN